MAFVVLAFVAAAIVGVQRADAQPGRFLAAVVSSTVRVQGTLPASEVSLDAAGHRLPSHGPGFAALGEHAPASIKPLVGSADASARGETSQVRGDRETRPARAKQPSERARRGRPGQEEERTAGRGAVALEKAHDSAVASSERAGNGLREAAEALEKAASKVARRAPEVSERAHSRLRRMMARAGHGPR